MLKAYKALANSRVGFPSGYVDVGSIPGSGRSPGEGNGNPLQYSCLENPMDRGAWWATVHRVAKSWTQLRVVKRVNPKSSPYKKEFLFSISLILYLYEMLPVVVNKKRSICFSGWIPTSLYLLKFTVPFIFLTKLCFFSEFLPAFASFFLA